jgi:hypothetical protein
MAAGVVHTLRLISLWDPNKFFKLAGVLVINEVCPFLKTFMNNIYLT